jgi:uncharacterized protein with HEPN domain
MSPRSSRFYLDDILAASRNIASFLVGINSSDELAHDLKTFHAVIRNIEIIGEACRQMPRGLKTRYSQIPWQKFPICVTLLRTNILGGFGISLAGLPEKYPGS